MNYLTPYDAYSLGWHCNIKGLHVRGCSNPMEAICKAAILVELGLYEGSEIYQKEKCEMLEDKYDYHTERFDKITEIINNMEREQTFTKSEMKQMFGIR